MYGRSAVLEASRKGVAPGMPSLPRPDAPFPSRRFTSAPRATRSRANWRLVSLPEPVGGGWPSGSSPRFGLRTHESTCSGVNPDRSSFGSAPAFTSSRANSKCAFATARSRALEPGS